MVQAQLSNRHYIPPVHATNGNNIANQFLYLSTPEAVAFPVTITDGAGTPIPGSPFALSNANPVIINLGGAPPSEVTTVVQDLNTALPDRGLILLANNVFYANIRLSVFNQAGSITSKGALGLGNEFWLGSMPSLTTQNDERGFFASVMATEDNTQVTIDNYDTDVTFLNDGPLIEDDIITFTLNAGETYVVAGRNNTVPNLDGFIGARVTSNNPIAVNTGSILGSLNSADSQDMGLDQLVPIELVDTEYICLRGNGSDGMERPMVVATQDNTEIFINGAAAPIATINAGEYYLAEGTNYQGTTHQNMYIETSSPSYIYQFVGGDNTDPTGGMSFIPPLSCNLSSSLNLIPDINRIGNTNFNGGVLVTTRTGAILTVNGATVTEQPEPVIGNVDWVTYKLNNLTGNTVVDSTEPITVGLFGASGLAGFYGFYSGFGVEINNEEVFTCVQEAPFNVLQRLPVVPDPSGIWTPGFASGTNIFDPATDTQGIYTYSNPNECTDILIEVSITFLEPLTINTNPTDIISCDDAALDGVETFDLTPNVDLVMTGLDRAQFNVTLHNDLADVNDGTNDIGTSYRNTRALETIYIRVAPIANDNCFALAEFTVEVVQLALQTVQTAPLDCSVTSIQLQANATVTGAGTITYAWSTTDGSIASGDDTPTPNIESPGTYTVIVADTRSGCTRQDTITVQDDLAPPIAGQAVELRRCDDDTDGDDTNGIAVFDLTLNDENVRNGQDTDLTITYHTSETDARTNTDPIPQPGTFTNTVPGQQQLFARIADVYPTCFDVVPFNIVVDALPVVAPAELIVCDFDVTEENASLDGIATFDLTLSFPQIGLNTNLNETVRFFVDQNAITRDEPITDISSYRNEAPFNQSIIALVTNESGCSREVPVLLIVQETTISLNNTIETLSCDLDATDEVDLGTFDLDNIKQTYYENAETTFYETLEDAEFQINQIAENNYNSMSRTIYAVVTNSNQCTYISEVNLTVPTPPEVFEEDSFLFCSGDEDVQIAAPEGSDTYIWFLITDSGEQQIVSQERILTVQISGNYSLFVAKDFIENEQVLTCFNEKNIEVTISEPAIINDVIIKEFSVNNSITVNTIGSGDYEYSIDEITFQESNIFSDVLAGSYTVTVRDKLGCGLTTQDVTVTSFPPFFTPNGDGINDTWQLNDPTNLYNGSDVTIYDRYGKLLYQYIVGRSGWTGEYNGSKLPSSDYWYVAKLIDGRVFKGHFTLKR